MRSSRNIIAGVMVLLLVCSLAGGQDRKPAVVEVEIGGVGKVQIPDLVVRDQEGRKVRFYSDLIKDKVVVLSFFYTSCIYVCTTQGQTFSGLQSLLGDRLGKSVFLISVSTDPAHDTPAQLKAWGKRYGIQPGWTLVTGDVSEMNKLLLPFTGNPAGAGMHLPTTFIGNTKTGAWISASGVFAPEDVLNALNNLTQ
ncbi:MAG TPA: SCO family protein [Pyrinomonadaceae bacterium]|nr:SCO family protein [Pyrinomonadaceae bacterium]